MQQFEVPRARLVFKYLWGQVSFFKEISSLNLGEFNKFIKKIARSKEKTRDQIKVNSKFAKLLDYLFKLPKANITVYRK